MGKKATKAADNMYYLARCEAAKTNPDFSSREKAAELVGIRQDASHHVLLHCLFEGREDRRSSSCPSVHPGRT